MYYLETIHKERCDILTADSKDNMWFYDMQDQQGWRKYSKHMGYRQKITLDSYLNKIQAGRLERFKKITAKWLRLHNVPLFDEK